MDIDQEIRRLLLQARDYNTQAEALRIRARRLIGELLERESYGIGEALNSDLDRRRR